MITLLKAIRRPVPQQGDIKMADDDGFLKNNKM